MNIVFLIANFISGGIGRVTSIIANELNSKPDINCFGLGHANQNQKDVFQTSFPVYYIFKDNVSMKNAILKHHYIRKLKQFIREHNIDIIIAGEEMFYPTAIIAARMCHIKVICWEHTNPYITTEYKFEKEAREFGARFSDCNLLLTKQAQGIFNDRYPKKKNIQIYNPVDSILFKREQVYDKSSKKIISVGRLCYQKNFERLIQIGSKFLKNHPDWTWDIYGDGVEKENLYSLLKEKHLQNQIYLCGEVENVYERYSQYAFIVMTSRFEGFPMTLLEAAANGLPMIAFDVLTGPAEIIKDKINGYLCNQEDDKVMIKRIETLMSEDKIRYKMSMESRKTAEQFHSNKICKQWIKLLQEIYV